jgi:hypothetical protein
MRSQRPLQRAVETMTHPTDVGLEDLGNNICISCVVMSKHSEVLNDRPRVHGQLIQTVAKVCAERDRVHGVHMCWGNGRG